MADTDRTRILGDDANKTRALGGDPNATRALGADPDRTRMVSPPGAGDRTVHGVPAAAPAARALTLTATPGNAYGLSADITREHVLFDIHAAQATRGMGGDAPAAQHLPGH